MIQDWHKGRTYRELSEKQQAVLELLSQNLTSKQIARQLNISHHAVEQRIQTIRTKYGQLPRSELGRLYSQLGPALRTQAPTPARHGPFAAEPAASGKSTRCSSQTRGSKQKFLLGFFAGFSLGLVVALVSVLMTYSLTTHAAWS